MQDLVHVTSQFNGKILTVFMWSMTIWLHILMHWQRQYKVRFTALRLFAEQETLQSPHSSTTWFCEHRDDTTLLSHHASAPTVRLLWGMELHWGGGLERAALDRFRFMEICSKRKSKHMFKAGQIRGCKGSGCTRTLRTRKTREGLPKCCLVTLFAVMKRQLFISSSVLNKAPGTGVILQNVKGSQVEKETLSGSSYKYINQYTARNVPARLDYKI